MSEILCDNCQNELRQVNADYQELLECFETMSEFFWNELGWCHFRAEFLARGDKAYERAQLENAKLIAQFLKDCESKWPNLARAIKNDLPSSDGRRKLRG